MTVQEKEIAAQKEREVEEMNKVKMEERRKETFRVSPSSLSRRREARIHSCLLRTLGLNQVLAKWQELGSVSEMRGSVSLRKFRC